MAAPVDVIVVGGGVVGAACARELARAGRRVRILEPDAERGQAWRAAAGMLAAETEAEPDDPLLPLAVAGRDLYPALAEALKETTGIDIGLWRGGILHVALTDDDAAELRARLAERGRRTDGGAEWLEPNRLREGWPGLAHCRGAMWAPREGAVAPRELVQALRADAERSGAELAADEGLALEIRAERVLGVIGRRERHPAADVVVAAGAWSARLGGLPRPLAVEPVRGQMAALPWPAGLEPAIVYHHRHYVLPRDDEAIVGSTMERAGFDASVTPDGLSDVLRAARAIYPPLGALEVRRRWAGLRPMTPDGLPILGPDPCVRGLWYATGHGRHGVLLAPISAVLLAAMMDGRTPAEDVSPFRPGRFWGD